jgi:hypothetical protein
MVDPNPALGISADFDADLFRNATKFAMQMGTNPDDTRSAVFLKRGVGATYWKDGVQLGSTPRLDRDGEPLDPEIEVRNAPDVEVRVGQGADDVDVAIEVERADADELPVGNFRPTKVTVTALDVDYAKIKDCREMIYNGDRYQFGYEPESEGLFEVGVYTMIFYAIDEA